MTETLEPTMDELTEARAVAARIVDRHGEAYLPIFIRLDREIEARLGEASALEKARRLARG